MSEVLPALGLQLLIGVALIVRERWEAQGWAVLLAIALFGPLIFIGGTRYPNSGWRGAIVLIVIAGVLGATVLALVDRVSASERLHRLLADTATDLVVRFAIDGTVLYASPAAYSLLGYRADELVGRTLDDLRDPAERPSLAAHIERVDSGSRASRNVFRMHHRDGRWLWFEPTARAIRDGSGKVIERRGAMRDVTERMQRGAEQAALSRLATLVARGVGRDETFNAVAEEVAQLFDAAIGSAVRFDPGAAVGTMVGSWSDEDDTLAGRAIDLTGETASAQVFRSLSPIRIEYPSAGLEPLIENLGVSGGISAPVFVSGVLWGVVAAAFRGSPPIGGETRLKRFADLVALAISNAESWEALALQATTDPLTGLANRIRRAAGDRNRARPAVRPAAERRADRHRPLQAGQRRTRASGRRHRAREDRRGDHRAGPHRRSARADRRRGVRLADATHRYGRSTRRRRAGTARGRSSGDRIGRFADCLRRSLFNTRGCRRRAVARVSRPLAVQRQASRPQHDPPS
jgi:PAS domain S-box-containing protein